MPWVYGIEGSSYPAGAVLLGATLRLQQGERAQIEALDARVLCATSAHPTAVATQRRSIFKNPPGMAAGRLFEELGLKGSASGER